MHRRHGAGEVLAAWGQRLLRNDRDVVKKLTFKLTSVQHCWLGFLKSNALFNSLEFNKREGTKKKVTDEKVEVGDGVLCPHLT